MSILATFDANDRVILKEYAGTKTEYGPPSLMSPQSLTVSSAGYSTEKKMLFASFQRPLKAIDENHASIDLISQQILYAYTANSNKNHRGEYFNYRGPNTQVTYTLYLFEQ